MREEERKLTFTSNEFHMENGPKSEIMLKFKSNWFVKRKSKERKVVIESIL